MTKWLSFVFLWLTLLYSSGAFRVRSAQRRHADREGGAVRVNLTQKNTHHGGDLNALKKALPSLHTEGTPESFLESFRTYFTNSSGGWTRVGNDILQNGNTKYQLGRLLGQGSYGMVFADLSERFAVKVIAKANITDAQEYQALLNEVANLKKVHQDTTGRADPIPSVVKFYDDFTIGDNLYIVMDKGGPELFDYIVQSRRIPENIAKSIFKQVIDGLDTCHSRNVAHRDLKPENILYDPSNRFDAVAGTATIIDFGLSVDTAGGTEVEASRKQVPKRKNKLLTAPVGTPNYAAPELITAPVMYDGPPVDVWAMGCTLYTMLCGHLPFDEGADMEAMYRQILSGKYHAFCPYMRSDARDLVKKMLNVNPDRRITISQIKEHPFVKAGGANAAAVVQGQQVEQQHSLRPVVVAEQSVARATQCPELYPICYTDRDCVIAACAQGCPSWKRAPSALTLPAGIYNHITGYDGSSNKKACTSNFQRVTAAQTPNVVQQPGVPQQTPAADPCAGFRAKFPNVQFDPSTGQCVNRLYIPPPRPVAVRNLQTAFVSQAPADPCAKFRAMYPTIKFDPALGRCVSVVNSPPVVSVVNSPPVQKPLQFVTRVRR